MQAAPSTPGASSRPFGTAGFAPDSEHVWRWTTDGGSHRAIIKFELLADLPSQPANATLSFDGCDHLGAANLRGTGFAAQDIDVQQLTAELDGHARTVEVNVTGLAGFLLAKTAAAAHRAAYPRTGTTSPSSSATTMPAAPHKRLTPYSLASPQSSARSSP